ncbi:MAG: PadR family transcriptional regulator [bacterium]|nr:PadR family transcriptional regulator [bacterium]
MSELTKFEEQILLSVWKLKDEAYGTTIYQNIQRITGREMAIGGVYFPLERLVKRGYLHAVRGEPTPIRGGQSKRYYRLSDEGIKVLIDAKMTQEEFWKDLPEYRYSAGE